MNCLVPNKLPIKISSKDILCFYNELIYELIFVKKLPIVSKEEVRKTTQCFAGLYTYHYSNVYIINNILIIKIDEIYQWVFECGTRDDDHINIKSI